MRALAIASVSSDEGSFRKLPTPRPSPHLPLFILFKNILACIYLCICCTTTHRRFTSCDVFPCLPCSDYFTHVCLVDRNGPRLSLVSSSDREYDSLYQMGLFARACDDRMDAHY